MIHLPPTTNPNAARVDDDDDHTIVVPPEDRCLVVPPDGRTRLARGLAELMRQQKAPLPASSPYRAALEEWLGVHKRKPRKPTLASIARQANRAAIAVARYEVKPDGTVVVVTGKGEAAAPETPWPLDEFRTKETKQ